MDICSYPSLNVTSFSIFKPQYLSHLADQNSFSYQTTPIQRGNAMGSNEAKNTSQGGDDQEIFSVCDLSNSPSSRNNLSSLF